MNRTLWITRLLMGIIAFFLLSSTQAGIPLWTFTPLTATTISVAANGSATIQYSVTNQSRRSHTLVMQSITGITQITTAGNCSNPFTLSYLQSCTLTLQVTGSALQGNVVGGPIVCQQGSTLQCYQPNMANQLNITLVPAPAGSTTLSASVSTLALKTSGVARIITITNTGANVANNVTYSASPAFPAGTTITPTSCGTMVQGGTCILTITPGATPSATPGDTNPTPITLSIAGTNTNTLTPTINILAYGSVYQSGYVFNFDDSTLNTGSIGGKVAALTDQAAPAPSGIIWASDGTGGTSANVDYFDIPGIHEDSIPPPCQGNADGSCNSTQILNHYTPTSSFPLNFYAAGLCKATIGSYSDWYLPAICELGYDTGGGSGCGTAGSPLTQNMQSNLVDNGDIGALTSGGNYWSSTEYSGLPDIIAWFQLFAVAGGSNQSLENKADQINVRCVRALTP
jgi:hypothetical protein